MKTLFCAALTLILMTPTALAQYEDMVFASVTPCVAFDTRPSQGGTGAMAAEEERTFHIVGSISNFVSQGGFGGGCGVPGFSAGAPQVQAVFINLIAIEPSGSGQIKAWATDKSEPVQGAFVNYQLLAPPMNNSNAVAIEVRQNVEGADITVKTRSASTHVRGVIVGYWTTSVRGGFLRLGSANGNSGLYFFDNGLAQGKSFIWDDSLSVFSANGGLHVAGSLRTGGALELNRSIYMESTYFGEPDGDQHIWFHNNLEATGETFMWHDSADRFLISNDLKINGDIFFGNSEGFQDGGLNKIVTDDTLAINRILQMESTASGEPDGDSIIYFYEEGSNVGETFRWDDAADAFGFSDALQVQGGVLVDGNLSDNSSMVLHYDFDNNSTTERFSIWANSGAVERLRIDAEQNDNILGDGAFLSNGLDYAEAFRIIDQTLEAGDVVALSLQAPEFIERATTGHQSNLVGVISANPGFLTGSSFAAEEGADPALAKLRAEARKRRDEEENTRLTDLLSKKQKTMYRPVALAGRVPVKVDGAFGAIKAGDYLTSSPTPGHAMVMTRPGPSIGIAMEGFDGEGPGRVLTLIQPGWYGGAGPRSSPGTPERLENESSEAGSPAAGPTFERPSIDRITRVAPAELAQYQPVSEPVEAGDVLVADEFQPGAFRRGDKPSDATIVGVVASETAVQVGPRAGGTAPIAVAGIVRCKVDASYGAIQAGDLLAASATRGYAMRAGEAIPGTILGKALEPLDGGTGTIKILVMMR
jgi:hypothetical protein